MKLRPWEYELTWRQAYLRHTFGLMGDERYHLYRTFWILTHGREPKQVDETKPIRKRKVPHT